MMEKKKNRKYYLFEMEMLPLNILSFVLLFLMVGITYMIDSDFFHLSLSYIVE